MTLPRTDTPPGLTAVLPPIERAAAAGDVSGLAEVLSRLALAGALDDPNFYAPVNPERYSRRLIWRDPAGRFVIGGFTWGAGQGSPLHDHNGLWGAEVIVEGAMSETAYDLLERRPDDRYHFARGEERRAERGAINVLRPPKEYHEFCNAAPGISRTLHVYGGDLNTSLCFRFDGEYWQAKRVDLRYDA